MQGVTTPNNFFTHLFGTIANLPSTSLLGNSDFIPTGSNNEILRLTGPDSAAWLGMKNKMIQKYAYEYCYAVASVVDKLAEYDISGCMEVNSISGQLKGNTAKNEWSNQMRRLMDQPNPMQTWEQFRGQQVMYKKVFGFCPVLPTIPSGMSPEYAVSMINLPPWLFFPIPTSNFNFIATSINDLISGWRVNLLGKNITLGVDDVFILEDSFMLDDKEYFILPQSRLVGLDMAVSNLCAGMEADNVLLRKRGPMGFISHDAAATKDSIAGYIPMSKSEKKRLQDDLARYGLSWSQYQYVVSRTAAKYVSMGYNVKELGTSETIVKAEKAICHRYAYPYVLYEEQDATYANGGNAKKGVYQDNVIPNSKKDLNKYNKFFKAKDNNCIIECDYSHVAAFQEDEKFKGQAAQLLDQGLQIEFQNNIITINEWRTARGYDTLPDGDKYFRDVASAGVLPTQVAGAPQEPIK